MAEPPPPPPPSSSIPELILSLEQAIMAAKQLPSTVDPSLLLQIHSSLHHAHHHLSSFLCRPDLPLLHPAENSLSSAAAAAAEPMQLGDDDENKNENEDVEQVMSSRGMVEGVEEKMRNCFIKKKRRKRRVSLSPSLAAAEEEEEEEGRSGFGVGAVGEGFDPYATRSKALELVYQFHG